MLLVDDRIGSKDLLSPLQKYGVPCDLARLEFADFAFIGRGIAGADVYVGIELKETRDLVSCMFSSRFAGHQLPGLLQQYDQPWLLTEGIWRAGDEGVLETMAGGWKPVSIGTRRIIASDVDSWILTQIIRGGVKHWHCSVRRDTIRFLSALYHWWTDKALDEHRSHQAIYIPAPERASLVEPSNFVKGVVGLVHDVGWTRASALEEACGGSMRRLAELTAKDLQQVPGIGKTIAQKILSALDGK